jgi:enoyl-CoA hydratase
MLYKSLVFQKIGAVGIITLNRLEANNAINLRLAEELADICADIDHDEETKVVIITGAGEKAFSVGTDPDELSLVVDGKLEMKFLSVATLLASLKSPVIAAINGDALGQGLELALACDLRIAAETANFSLPHITSGLIPWDGATQRLPRLTGKTKAMEMILTGQSLDSTEAYHIGLVSKILPAKELLPTVIDIAQTMTSKASLALKYAKEAIRKGLDLTLEQGLHLEADLYFLLQTTEDRSEGIRAFLEKRPPQFKGK